MKEQHQPFLRAAWLVLVEENITNRESVPLGIPTKDTWRGGVYDLFASPINEDRFVQSTIKKAIDPAEYDRLGDHD